MTAADSAEICLVVPCYNDTERLAKYLPELRDVFARRADVAILVVDDGSGAAEKERLRKLVAALDSPRLTPPLLLARNVGKGGAIYAGWDAFPRARWVGFVDADGATPAREVARMMDYVTGPDDPADVCIGSRIQMLGRRVDRTVKRHVVGRIFATLTLLVTGLPVYDSQCGCKLVRRSFYEKARSRLVERRFAFDIDLLVNLAAGGARLREFPVDWTDIPGGKVSILRDGVQMGLALVRLRRRAGKAAAGEPAE